MRPDRPRYAPRQTKPAVAAGLRPSSSETDAWAPARAAAGGSPAVRRRWKAIINGRVVSSGTGTTLATSPLTREKPFVRIDAQGQYNVFVPAVQQNLVGTTWASGPTPGSAISLDRFFIAQPTDSAATINRALGRGMNLLLSPGVYHLDAPLRITRSNTVVLGLGYPTLVPDDGRAAMTVATVGGVDVAGVMFAVVVGCVRV